MNSLPPTPPALPRRPRNAVHDYPAATPPPLPARPGPPPPPTSTAASYSSTSTSSTATKVPPPTRPVPSTPAFLPPRSPTPARVDEAPAAPRADPLTGNAPEDDNFSSDSDSDSDKEDAYEILASRIAAANPLGDDTSTLNSFDSGATSRRARLKGLRRRVLGGFRREEALHKKSDDSSSFVESVVEEDEQAALRRALDELDDVKVARFLDRVGHRVQEVSIAPPGGPVVFPETSSFTYNGRTDWLGFGTAVRYSPVLNPLPSKYAC